MGLSRASRIICQGTVRGIRCRKWAKVRVGGVNYCIGCAQRIKALIGWSQEGRELVAK
jgi:hypothetical protein